MSANRVRKFTSIYKCTTQHSVCVPFCIGYIARTHRYITMMQQHARENVEAKRLKDSLTGSRLSKNAEDRDGFMHNVVRLNRGAQQIQHIFFILS